MDSDGANHRFITNGQSIALTPRFSPDYGSIVYVSYIGKHVRIYIYDIGTGKQRLVTESNNPTFAPRWSPDGKYILYSMAAAGNTDIYRVSANGRSEEHTSELQSLMRLSYAVFCLQKKKQHRALHSILSAYTLSYQI